MENSWTNATDVTFIFSGRQFEDAFVKPNKCNQCDFASIRARDLRTHLKSNKCNQCDYTSSQVGNLRMHLKTHSGEKPDNASILERNFRSHLKMHSGEKSNKCNQCDFSSIQARTHLKTQWRKILQMQPSNVTMPALIRALSVDIWKCTVEKIQIQIQMQLCFHSSRPFVETFENAQWRKILQMQKCD